MTCPRIRHPPCTIGSRGSPLVAADWRLTLALDDTPTRRCRPHVQGPASTTTRHPDLPARRQVFVILAILAIHRAWGGIALPLMSRLYVRRDGLPSIAPWHRPEFRTKPDLAFDLLRWVDPWLGLLVKPVWVVAEAAYAKKDLFKLAESLGMTVVSWLRQDAALYSVQHPQSEVRRGQPRTYFVRCGDLAKRTGQRRGIRWCASRATRTSEGCGGGNCWARRFE